MTAAAPRKRALTALSVSILAVLVALWASADADEPMTLDPVRESAQPEVEPASVLHTAGDAVRQELPGDRPRDVVVEEADLDLPHAFRLRLRVQDWNGLPLPGAHVLVAPARCGFCRWPETTDDRGLLDLKVQGRGNELELWIAIAAFGTLEPMRVVTLERDRSAERVFVARGTEHDAKALKQRIDEYGPGMAMVLQFQDFAQQKREGDRRGPEKLRRRDELDTLCGRSLLLFEKIPCAFCHTDGRERTIAPFVQPPEVRAHRHPHGRFSDLGSEGDRASDAPGGSRSAPEKVPDREDAIRREFGPSGTGSVHGVVRDANGQPVPGAVVAWLGPDRQLRNRARTDEDGRYRLLLPAQGSCALVALAAGLGHDEGFVAAAPGTDQAKDFTLQASSSVQGRVTGESGAPLAEARVEFVSDSEPGAGVALVSKDGTYALADVPRSGRLLLWPGDADLRLPIRVSDSVLTDRALVDLFLSAGDPVRARLSLAPIPAPSRGTVGDVAFEVRVLQLDTGCAAHAAAAPPANGLRLEGLAAGFYRIDIGAPGCGWTTLGPVHLDGRGMWDLGATSMPQRGVIEVFVRDGARPAERAIEFWLQREDLDVRVPPLWLDPTHVELPIGTYALVFADEHGATRSRRVVVAAGSEVAVALDR